LVRTREGELYVWGSNNEGQLGLGDQEDRDIPVLLEMPNKLPVVHVACGRDSSFAVTSDGSLFGWGVNSVCVDEVDSPILVPLPSGVTKVWVGRDHAFAKTRDDEIYVWGYNWSCQCGKSSSGPIAPELAPDFFRFSEIMCGGHHNLALDSERKIWAWGRNTMKQLGVEGDTKVPTPQKILGEPIDFAAAGLDHSLAVTESGELFGWGRSVRGQIGIAPESDSPPKKITLPSESPVGFVYCGCHHSVVMTTDGTLYLFGTHIQGSTKNELPKIVENFKWMVPLSVNKEKKWKELMSWLFLSHLDENSELFEWPIEILYHFVCLMVNKNF
jgi:alpha-tubulin suppressor-like RCC1 family protein